MLYSVLTKTPLRKTILLLSVIIIVFIIASLFPLLVIVTVLSLLLSFLLYPIRNYLEYRFGIKRSVTVIIIYIVGFTTLSVLFATVFPFVLDRVVSLYSTMRHYPFDKALNAIAVDISIQIPFIDTSTIIQNIYSSVAEFQNYMDSLLFKQLFQYISAIIVVPFFTFFILIEGDNVMKRVIEYIPNKYFEMTLNVLYKIKTDLIGYLKGWVLDSIIIGILSIFGYFIIGIDYAFTLGILAGIANLIPYVGPIVGTIPAIILSLIQYGDFQKLTAIVIMTIIIQLIDNIIVQPLCFAKTVDMHPVTVIIVLLIGNSLMGVTGMLLAIPLYTIIKASVKETYWGLKNYKITT